MDWVKAGIALVELLADLVGWLKEREWYQKGAADADAKANAVQQTRIAVAKTARAAPDQYANSKAVDPYDRG